MQSIQQEQQPCEYDAVDEWISNWQFERVAPLPPTSGTTSEPHDRFGPAVAESTEMSDEDGVFFFERVLPAPAATASTGIDESADVPSSFDMDMGNDDDLFSDLEAAAGQIDDGEISFGDFMDDNLDLVKHVHINVKNDRYLHQDQHDEKSTATSVTTPLIDDVEDDEDVDMLLSDNDDYFYQTAPPSPVVSGPYSASSCNSPTSVTNVLAQQLPGAPPLAGSSFSAKTRPALLQMRKMMNGARNSGARNSAAKSSGKNLPCAAGMDEMYLETLRNLQKSMDRTKRSRTSLSVQTKRTERYGRSMCVHQIVKSVKISSKQVDTCLQSVVGY